MGVTLFSMVAMGMPGSMGTMAMVRMVIVVMMFTLVTTGFAFFSWRGVIPGLVIVIIRVWSLSQRESVLDDVGGLVSPELGLESGFDIVIETGSGDVHNL